MPIVKWVGGKRQLLDEIEKRLPTKFNIYHEPFFGGGALLFHLQPKKAVINDINDELMTTYQVVKDNPIELLASLGKHQNTPEYFYSMRDKDRNEQAFSEMSIIEKASRLVYLNKTCYNGLFRVNAAGQFNTPFGGYKNPNIVNKPVILAVSEYLNTNAIEIVSSDFEMVLKKAKENDFIYLDPPYDPISDTAAFTGYNEGGFDKDEQLRLFNACLDLNNRGVMFMQSNSATDFIINLYKDFKIDIVKARRNVNSNAAGRSEIDEVIIRNY